MKTGNEIITALKLQRNKSTNAFASKLASYFGFAEQIKKEITEVSITETGLTVDDAGKIRELKEIKESYVFRLQAETPEIDTMRKKLSLFTASRITIKTGIGTYSLVVPVKNKYYYALCDLLGIAGESEKIEVVAPTLKIVTHANVIDKIKKAAKFTSKDNYNLRPAMTCICLDFSGKGLQVVATDAHKLYYSQFISCEVGNANGWKDISKIEPMQLLIAPESIKAIANSKPDYSKALEISVYGENKALINGIEVNLLADTKYPNYRVVIPEHKHKMTFERKGLITVTKQLLPFANHSTNQVQLHINGLIHASAQDVDFSNESIREMKYISKDFIDTNIAFNGKYLIETLSAFTTNELAMYSEGQSNKAAIFTDNTDHVLLMPFI